MIRRMEWSLDVRETRRLVPSRRGRLDLRRSLRRNLARGGEILEFARRDRKRKRRPLALLCDISGSMEPYSRILLQFLYVASRGLDHTEAFVFGTRLTRITRQLRHRDVDEALRAVHHDVQDFGGGTRIGEAIRAFNRLWSRRVLGQGAAVLIISDGWDRGEPEALEREMARLQRSAYRTHLAQPAARLAALRAAHARPAGGAALRRRLPAGAQPGEPRGSGPAPAPAAGRATRAAAGSTKAMRRRASAALRTDRHRHRGRLLARQLTRAGDATPPRRWSRG